MDDRGTREISHGAALALGYPERTWGWGTAAGRIRAKRRADYIATSAQLGNDKKVLEIGCGTGLFTEMFAQSGARLVAVDISSDLLRLAKQRGLHPEQVQFLEVQFEDIDTIEAFDAVIGSSVLHHLDIDIALKRVFDLLRPGGMMSFAEPNMLNPQIFLQKNIPWLKERMGDSPDETAFVSRRLRKTLQVVGFTEIQIVPRDWLHPATPVSLITMVTRLESWFEKCPLVREFSGSLYISGKRPNV